MPFDTRSDGTSDSLKEKEHSADEHGGFQGIWCPVCAWKPLRTSIWQCGGAGPPENFPDGCGTVWNTFDTHGRCPGCGHQWKYTSCHGCPRWSAHEDWYESVDGAHPDS
ncbi:MAG: hypothetical protein J5I65_15190 [Aridibacter famidurans]|nr:hypothetical protein [Aridibacter famidurans]